MQRAGTSWWHRLICDHPQVHRATGKELHFFDRYVTQPFAEIDVEAYHRRFPRPPGLLTGEWTPRYIHDFWTPELLRRSAPAARLIVLLRDPLYRYRSGVAHERAVLRRELRSARGPYIAATIVSDALDRSLYSRQLTRLFASFDRSRVLILQYERCVADPAAELQRTYEFLGLDEGHVPPGIEAQVGPSHRDYDAPGHLLATAIPEIERDARELKRIVPEIDLDLWPSCEHVPRHVSPSVASDSAMQGARAPRLRP